MTSTDSPAELISIGEAARILGVSVDTIRRWDVEGRVQCIRTPGGQRRISQDEIGRIREGGVR